MSRHEGKTEAPTPKRKRDARRDGRVARSPDLVAWVSVLIGTAVLPSLVTRTANATRQMLAGAAQVAKSPDPAALPTILGSALRATLTVLLPALLAFFVIALVGNLAQVGFILTGKPLKPKMSHLNPIEGFKRLFSVKGLWQAASATMKLTVILAVAYAMLKGVAGELISAPMRSAADSVTDLGSLSLSVVRTVAFVAIVISLADYAIKRRDLRRELRMTKQEVRQEAKDSEGDPHVRARMRSMRMAMTRNRMLNAIAGADVVITNPTHISIAISYSGQQGVPKVVARGAGSLAARIREEADRHHVPRVESKPLARTLYRLCRPGEEIPAELYQAVATVLAFLHRLGESHRSFTGRLHLDVADTWTPAGGGELRRVPPKARARLARLAENGAS